jgi:hypothetical protein
MKYKELIYKGNIYTEKYQIEEILVKEKLAWFINAETEKAKIEISDNILIFNGGIWYTGVWQFGAWRAGEWKFGSWENGVWFNGSWQDGIFKNGIIFNGTFFQGQFLNAKLRKNNQDGTETRQDFINCDLSPIIKKI